MAQPTIFQASVRRRWLIIIVAGALLAASSLFIRTPTPLVVAAFLALSGVLNTIAWLMARTDTSHRSFAITAFLLDLMIATAPIVVIGAGGLLVGLVAVVVPYTLRATPTMSRFHASAAAIAYLTGVVLHGKYFALPARALFDVPVVVWIELSAFIAAVVLVQSWASHINHRLRTIREALPHSGQEETTEPDDELNSLVAAAQTLSTRLDNTARNVSGEARAIIEYTDVMRLAAERAADANARLVESSGVVVDGLEVQRRGAEAGERRGNTAIEYSRELGDSATTVANEVNALLQHAESARKQIQRSNESLSSIEHDVSGTLNVIEGLKATAHAAHETLQTVLSVARQTHVLALNTAIKAANGEISQESSSDIAARFRTLASDTSASTRDAAQLLDEMKEHVAVAERAMRAGQTQAHDAAMFTETASAVLQQLHLAALRSNELVGASVDVSRIQAEHLTEMSKHLSEAATSRVDTTRHVATASQAVTTHKATIRELEQAVAQLAETADTIAHHFLDLSPGTPGSPD